MTYSEALSFLYEQLPMFHRIGKAAYKADLHTTHALCRILGNPELTFPSIHIAGTNGKGSVSSLIASVLQEAGYKTALFTSPHLADFRERIRINGVMIPKERVIHFIESNSILFQEIKPSFFEWTFALAADYFASSKVDIAIMETGMGGRLDSTNVVRSILSIITNISDDHKEFLGDTLPEIALEKAGIMKPGIPVIIGETQSGISGVFKEKANTVGCPVRFADRLYSSRIIPTENTISEIQAAIKRTTGTEQITVSAPLAGRYQKKNLVTAYAALEEIRRLGFPVEDVHIRQGFAHVKRNSGLKGRWEVFGASPLRIADTGHNPAGLKVLISQLLQQKYTQLHFVLGMVNDKDRAKILTMLPKSWQYYFCKPDIPRGLDAGVLAAEARKAGLSGNAYPDVREAYLEALKNACPEDLIFVGGSTFVVAGMIESGLI